MTTPWTPPGQDLPEPAAQAWQAAPPPTHPHPAYPPPAFQRQPAYPGGPHPDGLPPSKAMASWALGLTIVGFCALTWVVGVVLAIVVLVQGRDDPRDRGQSRAIGALVIAGVWVVIFVIGVAVGIADDVNDPDPSPLGPPTSRTPDEDTVIDHRTGDELPQVIPAKLRVGDCFNDATLVGLAAGGDDVESDLVTLVPCERLHDFEAYHVFRLRGDAFPGADAVSRQAGLGCAKAFKPYVGRAYGPSRLDFWMYYPTQTSWAVLADHGVACVIGEPGKQTAGVLRGSRR